MTTKTLNQRIAKTPSICRGKPHIYGHRITVQNVAIWYDRLGWSADEKQKSRCAGTSNTFDSRPF